MADEQALAQGFMAALDANTPYTPPSADGTPLSWADALAVQRAFVALRAQREPVAGYKAAVNAPALQQLLGIGTPIVGALFASGARAPGSRIARASYRGLAIETEIGFRAARVIDKRVQSLGELRNAISSCAPMFELADPGFGRVRMHGHDLLAANAAAAGYVQGPPRNVQDVDVNTVRVTLTRDGETLHEAEGRDLMGDQWRALLWLVNTAFDAGYAIQPGQLLMTGSLGPAHPAQPGHYRADFGVLGVIEMDVE